MPNKSIHNKDKNYGTGIRELHNSNQTQDNTNSDIVNKRITEIKKEYKDFILECILEHKKSLLKKQENNEFINIDAVLDEILKKIRMSFF